MTLLEKRSNGIINRVFNAPVEHLELTTLENASDIGPNGETGRFELGKGPTTVGRALSRRTTDASTIPKTIFSNTAKRGGKYDHHNSQATSVQSTCKGSLPSTQNGNVDGSSHFRFSELFPIELLQKLSRIESALQEIGMVIKVNADVLLEIMEHYQRLINDPRFPTEIKQGSSTAISEFFQQITSIVNDLKREQCCVDSFLQVLSNGNSMVNNAVPGVEFIFDKLTN